MPVTKEQAQMLATLAVAARPHGAPRWEQPGVMAAIAKVKHMTLADVVLATIRAADDRDVKTPGVIGNPQSPCWQERAVDRGAPRRDWPDDAHRCRTCSEPRERCRRLWHDDHPFEPATSVGRLPEAQIAAVVAELRDHKAADPPPRPEPEQSTAGTERVAPVRAALAERTNPTTEETP